MLAPPMRNSTSSWDEFPFFVDPKLAPNLELWLDEPESQQLLGIRPPAPAVAAPVMKPTGPKDWSAPIAKPQAAPQCSCVSAVPFLSQQHMCPPAPAPNMRSIGSLCPMAFWSVETRKLLAFNDGFHRLLQLPADYLQRGGVQWDNFADSWQPDPAVRADVDESFARMKDTATAVSMCITPYNQQQYVFLTSNGQTNTVELTMLLVGAELMWIIQDSPSPQMQRRSPASPVSSSVSPSPPVANRRASISGSPFSTDGDDSGDEYGASEQQPKKRHPRFKPKPWDDSVTKFSLPKQKNPKKRSRITAT